MKTIFQETVEWTEALYRQALHQAARRTLTIAFCSGVHSAYLFKTNHLRTAGLERIDDVHMALSKKQKNGFHGKTAEAIEQAQKEILIQLQQDSSGFDSIRF